MVSHSATSLPAPVIAPSILSADFARLGDEVVALEAGGADWVHFDVMDNHYVPNLTMGPMFCKALRKHVRIPLDVHLMVENPDPLVDAFADAGADILSVHPESTRHLDRTLQLIRDRGCKAGVVLNPASPLSWLDHVLGRIDLVLLMTVNPGFGGQSFIEAMLAKIGQARARLTAHHAAGGAPVRLQVDGGVNPKNIATIAAAGADAFVAGSAVFGAPDADGGYRGVIGRLREAASARYQA
ncbi:MAG: ribulose-phosphate 3-epimerase [Burkholderiaceae bacterium]